MVSRTQTMRREIMGVLIEILNGSFAIYVMMERRHLARTMVAQPAKVLAADTDVAQNCVVHDLTTQGACVVFNSEPVVALPRTFYLTFDNCRTLWDCQLIWQDIRKGRVGVSWRQP